MSEYEPITSKLRWLIDRSPHGKGPAQFGGHLYVEVKEEDAIRLCDEIDAVHRNLEQESETLQDENDGLQESVRRLLTQRDERLAAAERAAAECKTISTAYVDVKLRIDWERMACEFEQFASVVRGMAGGAESTPPTPASIMREYTEKLCGLCSNEYDSNEARDELLRQYAEKLTKCLES